MKTSKTPASTAELVQGVDTTIFLDDVWYTTEGAVKLLGIGRTTLSKEIKSKKIEVFKHPNGNLFSKDAIANWVERRTAKARR